MTFGVEQLPLMFYRPLKVKEYITKNSQENEVIFKGIYERLDSEIEKYEMTIEQLKQELHAAKKDDIPYQQLANEVSAAYPDIKKITIGNGAHIELDSLNMTHCVFVKVQTDSLMPEASLEQLKRWLMVRLQSENVEIYN